MLQWRLLGNQQREKKEKVRNIEISRLFLLWTDRVAFFINIRAVINHKMCTRAILAWDDKVDMSKHIFMTSVNIDIKGKLMCNWTMKPNTNKCSPLSAVNNNNTLNNDLRNGAPNHDLIRN